jgi:serine phosphatase RsbU (regulator of sigma subunit)
MHDRTGTDTDPTADRGDDPAGWHAVGGSAPLDAAERERLAAVEASALLGTPPEERFDRITRFARELFDVPMSYLNLVDDASLVVKSPQEPGEAAPRFPYGAAFCEYTVHGTGLFEVTDASLDPRFAESPAVTAFGVRSYAGVPLRADGGQAIGTLCILHPEPRRLTGEERGRLVDLGRWAEAEIRQGQGQGQGQGRAPEDAAVAASAAGRQRPALHHGDLTATALDRPHGAVSGDLHAWAEGGDVVTATLADVMGKGAAAGALAEALRRSLYEGPDGTEVPPATALSTAARALGPQLAEAGSFVTLFHARVDTLSGDVEYVDAGHGLTLHLRAAGPVERLSSHDLPLGLQDAAEGWTTGTLRLEPGDALVSVSDGVLDVYDSTLASLDRVVADLRAERDVEAFLDAFSVKVGVARVDDDVTVLVVTRS